MADEVEGREEKGERVWQEIKVSVKDIDRHADRSPYLNREYVGLCFSCSNAWITRTKRHNDPVVRCTNYGSQFGVTPTDIIECNGYEKRGEVGIWDLVRMHTIVDLSSPDKVMGFKPDEGKER